MAAHHGKENIRVNCVAPGMVYTPMTRGRGMTDEMRQARINQNLMKKEGTGWDVGYGKSRSYRGLFLLINLLTCALSSYSVPRQQRGGLDYWTDHAC